MSIDQPPLIIDLDNSLITSDTLIDSISKCLSANIFNIFKLFLWILQGRSVLKYNLSKNFIINAKEIYYRSEILALIENSKKKGKKIFLCSGANENQVKIIYEDLGLFDDFYGSSLENNLTGKKKKKFLEEKFGFKKFEYLGDSAVDIPVWESCKKAYLINVSNAVKHKLIKNNIEYKEIKKRSSFFDQLKVYIKAIRIYQWVKNLLIFLPIFLSQEFSEINFLQALIAFACFSFISSFVYVFNDFLDIKNDRNHPTKKTRPIASGEINIFNLFSLALTITLISFLLAYLFLGNIFCYILLLYIMLNLFYSTLIKSIYFLDVLTLSSFYTLRLISGGIINDISLSPWLISFSIFFFLFLALIKRIGEIKNFVKDNKVMYGISYDEKVLDINKYIIYFSSFISLLLLIMYFFSEKALTLYNNVHVLILICPLIIIWKVRLYRAAMQNNMHDDPIVYIVKDKLSWLLLAFTSLIIISQMKIW